MRGSTPDLSRRHLTRGRVVAAAIDHADLSGPADFSMRSLGAVLGVEAMALYRYVASKDELLLLMAGELVERLARTSSWPARGGGRSRSTSSWEDDVRGVAQAVDVVVDRHEGSVRLLAARGPAARWPGVEQALVPLRRSLVAAGLSDAAAAAGCRMVLRTVVARTLTRVGAAADVVPPPRGQVPPDELPRLGVMRSVAEESFPYIARMMPLLSTGPGPDLLLEVVIVEIGALPRSAPTRRRSARGDSV